MSNLVPVAIQTAYITSHFLYCCHVQLHVNVAFNFSHSSPSASITPVLVSPSPSLPSPCSSPLPRHPLRPFRACCFLSLPSQGPRPSDAQAAQVPFPCSRRQEGPASLSTITTGTQPCLFGNKYTSSLISSPLNMSFYTEEYLYSLAFIKIIHGLWRSW